MAHFRKYDVDGKDARKVETEEVEGPASNGRS